MKFNRAALFAGLAAVAAFATGNASAAAISGSYPPGNPRQITPAGRVFIENEEGFSPNAYKDGRTATGIQLYSIGYGHQITGRDGLTKDSVISREKAAQLLLSDIADRERAVIKYVRVPLTQNQFNALVSFIYNVGIGAFAGSTLLQKLNRGDYAGARAEFAKWTKGGTQNVGRRQREANLFGLV